VKSFIIKSFVLQQKEQKTSRSPLLSRLSGIFILL